MNHRLNDWLKDYLNSNHIGYGPSNHSGFLPINSQFEPPCSIKNARIAHSISLGAFSYVVSGYLFGTRVGRYCSFGEDVQLGRHSHPITDASSSPLFYRSVSQVLDFRESHDPYSGNFERTRPPFLFKPITIGHDVYIGHGALIMPGITVGDGAVVGAMSVVTKDVSPYTVVAGNPAKVIRTRFSLEIINRFLELKWWAFSPKMLSGLNPQDSVRFLDGIEALRCSPDAQEYKPKIVDLNELKPSKY